MKKKKMKRLFLGLRYKLRNVDSIQVAPMRLVALILLIIAWSTGAVHGILAWILLLLLLDVKGNIKIR